MTAVLACYLAFTAWEATRTPLTSGELALFAALMCCGAICVEATRRLGQPTGVWRDLLSAWWIPVALLLPPLYALAAPAVLGLLSYIRVPPAAVGPQGVQRRRARPVRASASALFRLLTPAPPPREAAIWLAYPGPNTWLMRPQQAAVALGSAVAFGVLNAALVAVAAWLADPDARLAGLLADRERLLLDLTETCVGILVTIACALSTLLLAVALPPVLLLQRSLLHSQLKAQARTDAKTGVLNVGAWQGEAGLAVAQARRREEPLAMLLADVDHFKALTTTGTLPGDAVLRTLAAEMRQQVASPTSSAGSAARSSRSCSTAPRRRRPAWSPSGSAGAPASSGCSPRTRSWASRSPSASRSSASTAPTSASCSRPRTGPGTEPAPAATGCASPAPPIPSLVPAAPRPTADTPVAAPAATPAFGAPNINPDRAVAA